MRIKVGKFKINLVYILICIFVLGIIYSALNIFVWKIDNDNLNNIIDDINEDVTVDEVEDSLNTEIISQEIVPDEFNPYWDYIKMNLINVDFNDLKSQNSDVVGWIQVNGTNINYPFVQTVDNSFYLNHSFTKGNNQSGWAFMDFRNNSSDYDKNTIIYGHSLQSGAIFGTLKNVFSDEWKNNFNNHIIKLSTPNENSLWRVFSIYTISDTSDYLKTVFDSDDDFLAFKDMLLSRSVYNFNSDVFAGDKILTLSTCYGNGDTKAVVHAKLIKREAR